MPHGVPVACTLCVPIACTEAALSSCLLATQLLGISSGFLSSLLSDYLRGTISDTKQQVARAIQLRDIMTSLGPGEGAVCCAADVETWLACWLMHAYQQDRSALCRRDACVGLMQLLICCGAH